MLHVGTFSLLLFPGIRIGYVCGTRTQIEELARVRWIAGRHNPELQQAALRDLLRSGQFDDHMRRRRRLLRTQRQALLESIQKHFGDRAQIHGDHAGTFLLLSLRCRGPKTLIQQMQADPELGLEVVQWPHMPGESKRRTLHLPLCFAALTPEQIRRGISRVSRLATKVP